MSFLCGSSSALALVASKEAQLEEAKLFLAEVNAKLAQVNAKLSHATSKIAILELENSNLEEQLEIENSKMELAASKMRDLEAQIGERDRRIEELDDTYSLGWAETSQKNADLTKANADLVKANADLAKENADLAKENEELHDILDQVSSCEIVERNVAAMEETIESMQAELYELHYFLGSKGYKARMLHAEGIRIPDEGAHAWWGFSACTRRNEDGTYSFFAHPEEEKTRPANMVNPNYGKQILHYARVTKAVINQLREGK
jgi:cob(I)alamin adenosyltransferase